MPKAPAYTLAWSSVTGAYELYQTRDRGVLRIVVESPDWFAWLDQVSSFAFVGKSGHYTARKEAKQRGDRYWSAYLTMDEHLTKKYLGKTADLTLARLEHIAGTLCAQSESQLPPPCQHWLRPVLTRRWMAHSMPDSLICSILFCQPNCMCRARARTWCPALISSSDSGRAWHARLSTRRVWQNHPSGPVVHGERFARRLALLGSGGQRPHAFSLLPDCRLADP